MKKILTLLTLSLASLCCLAQNGRELYEKFSSYENVSAVYISPAMFKMVGGMQALEEQTDAEEFIPDIKEFRGMYIINSENPAICDELYGEAVELLNSRKYELLMEAKDDGETVHIYACYTKDYISSFILLAREIDEVSLVIIDGKILQKDLDTMMSGNPQK